MPKWLYSLRNAPLHGFVLLMLWLVRILPARAAFSMGRWLALTVWWLMPRWRRTAHRNMEIFSQGGMSRAERARIGRESAINLGYYVIEFMRMGFMPVDDALHMIVETEGLEHYKAALREGRGVIALAMHYGNWDLSGAYLASRIRKTYAVGKEQRDAFFDRFTFPWRARYGINNIMAGKKANSAILRALKENCVLGLLAEQNGGTTGLFAPFAGTLASTVPGPAVLSLKTGAPMLVSYCKRIAPGRLKLVVKPQVDMSGLPDDKRAAIIEVLTRVNAAYEVVIREDPTQWLWGHKRWKTRPEGKAWLY